MDAPLLIDGDVDIRTGDIEGAGDIVVKGDVRSGLTVKAKGSVKVQGVVETSTIAAGGHVEVGCGIAGRGKGKIQAGGKISIGYANQATLESKAGIVIRSYAMNSTLLTDEDVLIAGEGVLVGGILMAGGSVFASRVGHKGADVRDTSKGGAIARIVESTVVMLGLPPRIRRDHLESRSRLSLAEKLGRASAQNAAYLLDNGMSGIDSSLSERAAFLVKAPVTQEFLESMGAGSALETNEELRVIVAEIAGRLPSPMHAESKDAEIQNLALQLYHLYVANKFIVDLFEENIRRLSCPELNAAAELRAKEMVHEGVKVTIGFKEVEIGEDMGGTVFRLTNGEIKMVPFNGNAADGGPGRDR
ncbi:MAG: DUF342 domain-containing protein [Candidatus Coatesbacteria bacterium]|nr:DUF342 domain-containing protein [Candidatus Coatesbacteria bacterium]